MNLESRHYRTAAVGAEVEGVDCYYAAAVGEARSRLGLLEKVAEEAVAAGRIAELGESQVMLEEVSMIALGIASVDGEFQPRVKQYQVGDMLGYPEVLPPIRLAKAIGDKFEHIRG